MGGVFRHRQAKQSKFRHHSFNYATQPHTTYNAVCATDAHDCSDMSGLSIEAWIEQVGQATTVAVAATATRPNNKKRKLPDLPSPPCSPRAMQSSDLSSPSDAPKKRRRNRTDDHDLGDIPRARTYAASASASASTTSRSTASSPTKRSRTSAKLLADLAIETESLQPADFNFPDALQTRAVGGIPTALDHMLDIIDDIATGQGIVPSSLRSSIDNHIVLAKAFRRRPDAYASGDHIAFALCASEQPTAVEGSFAIDQIVEILEDASECSLRSHAEATWNAEVYQPLLRLALRSKPSSANFTPCTVARISQRFHIHNRTSKMVDYCMFLEPYRQDPQPTTAVDAIKRCRLDTELDGSINHTSYPPLIDRPITPSIETKPEGQDWGTARSQLAVWQLAQWKALGCLIASRFLTADEGDAATNTAWATIQFLPGCIVQGHEWYFVATSRHASNRTILWLQKLIGSTATPLGIFQIITALRYFAAWSEHVYWPWFQEHVLGLGDTGVAPGNCGTEAMISSGAPDNATLL